MVPSRTRAKWVQALVGSALPATAAQAGAATPSCSSMAAAGRARVATRDGAPYRQVITHGFTVDAAGRRISKSLGNDVDTHKLIAASGAEVLRLWTIMVDYREDMPISQEMFDRLAEAYRKIRNTCRYLLANL